MGTGKSVDLLADKTYHVIPGIFAVLQIHLGSCQCVDLLCLHEALPRILQNCEDFCIHRVLEEGPSSRAASPETPEIVIEHICNGSTAWSHNLAEIDDDMQTRYIRAQRAELLFTLQVSSHNIAACQNNESMHACMHVSCSTAV